jgi:ribokinase
MIQVSSTTHDNSIIVLAGANSSLLPIPSDFSKWTHLLVQNEIPISETITFVKRSKAVGVTTLFSPTPMLSIEQSQSFPWDAIDYLLVNEEEAKSLIAQLSPNLASSSLGLSSVLAQVLHTCGAEGITVIVTKGSKGAELAGVRFGVEECLSVGVEGFKVNVVDTTGAGDCFAGFFASALASNMSFRQSFALEDYFPMLHFSVHAASMAVETEGAMASYPSDVEVFGRYAT